MKRLHKANFSGRFWALLPLAMLLGASLGALLGFSMYVVFDIGSPFGNVILGALPGAIIGLVGLLDFEVFSCASEIEASSSAQERLEYQDKLEIAAEEGSYREGPRGGRP